MRADVLPHDACSYTRYGALADVASAVQSAVMWQLIYNPIEQGPLAPVIRGNPWGLDKGTVNDDWAYGALVHTHHQSVPAPPPPPLCLELEQCISIPISIPSE